MNRRGLTLLEVMIAMAILAGLLTTLYTLLFASQRAYDSEVPLRELQFQMQMTMDQIDEDIKETSNVLVRTVQFADANFTNNQSILIVPSARDANGQFQVINTKPQWQKLIIYAPYYDAQLKRGELRRYELAPIPPAFTNGAANPVIQVTANDITLEGVTFPRTNGTRVLNRVLEFTIDNSTGTAVTQITVEGNIRMNQKAGLLSGARGRN